MAAALPGCINDKLNRLAFCYRARHSRWAGAPLILPRLFATLVCLTALEVQLKTSEGIIIMFTFSLGNPIRLVAGYEWQPMTLNCALLY